MVQGLLQPLDGFIVFLLLLSGADGEREVRTGEGIVKIAIDSALSFCNRDRVRTLVETFGIFPALKVWAGCISGCYSHRCAAYWAF